MIGFFKHLFFPHESNNHRPKVLHHSSLFFFIALLLSVNLFTTALSLNRPDILGVTANISAQELLDLTNQKRVENGLSPLTMSNELSKAAEAKGQDMFSKNYWAHNSPDGLTPWVFIKGAGYDYVYAGENLARGFTSASEVVDAWMQSPGHRENMLSPNYKEIGFSIQSGVLTDDETILVVEEFGSRNIAGSPQIASAQEATIQEVTPTLSAMQGSGQQITLTPTPSIIQESANAQGNFVAAITSEPLINKKSVTRNIPLLVIIFFMLILLFDMFIIERKKIDRIVGHNLDHLIFFSILLIAVIAVGRGIVL